MDKKQLTQSQIDKETINEDVVIFKSICTDLFNAQVDNKSYEAIVNMVLDTKYGNFAKSDTLTLNEIGYIFDITRERVRQLELSAKKKLINPGSKSTLLLNRYLALSGEDKATNRRLIASVSARKLRQSQTNGARK